MTPLQMWLRYGGDVGRRVAMVPRRRAAILVMALEGRRDARDLARRTLIPTDAERRNVGAAIRDAYEDYVTNVSVPGMACSFETSVYLMWLCRMRRPAAVLDLGSGFSSWVLRRYARDYGARALSVDDSPDWLSRTAEFLTRYDLPTDDLVMWSHFRPEGRFGLVFHDLAMGDLRECAMPSAVEAAAPGGLVVFDDAQHAGHRRVMRELAGRVGARLWNARAVTLDEIQRFAMVAEIP